jgi:16S rRNA (cytidine1402-2'-O)-methyltransferase
LEAKSTGKLYLVSTPIGNLNDITIRAIDVLSNVALIAAEDTRHAAILLRHYEISTPTTSFFSFNKEKKTPGLIQKLLQGQSIALISDAGTPGISDPAFHLVHEAIRAGITVEAIPGATAFVPALITSGLATNRFVFEGFLPTRKGRQKRLQEIAGDQRTIIIYESPQRLLKTLADLKEHFGNRRIAIARELTKKFEQIYRGTLEEICQNPGLLKLKGEFVLVIEGK